MCVVAGGVKKPILQADHQDFHPGRLKEVGERTNTEHATATVLMTLDPYGSVIIYHPDKSMRDTTRPYRIMLPNPGDAVVLLGNCWHGGDVYLPARSNMSHVRAHWYMVDPKS